MDSYLGAWVNSQRKGKNKLSSERIKLLEALPQWSWNPLKDQWNEGFEYLKKYAEEQGHAKILLIFKYEDFNLGAWVSSQRKGKNKLSSERIKLLESLPQWSWDTFEDQWNEGFEYLKKYIAEYGHAKVPNRFKYENFNLGTWVNNQRQTKEYLDLKRIQLLEELPQWSWNPFEDQWNEIFKYLNKYVEEYGHARVTDELRYQNVNIGAWVSRQRTGKNKLSPERIKLLESLPKWSWNPFEDQWNDGFKYLNKYVEEQGHARVPKGFKYEDFNLGIWTANQRKTKDKLDLEKIQQLESLPQWSWDVLEDKWNEGVEHLKKYIEEYGHARVPQELKYEDFNLGNWVAHRRKEKNKLSPERIQKLESLPQWSWGIKKEKY